MTNYKEYQIAESTLFYNVQVPSTSLPIAHTARMFKSWSRIKISASFPFCKEPLRSYTPINLRRSFGSHTDSILQRNFRLLHQGTDQTVHGSHTACQCRTVCQFAHTILDDDTRIKSQSLLSLAAHAKASVMTQARSTPFIL